MVKRPSVCGMEEENSEPGDKVQRCVRGTKVDVGC